MNSLDLYQLEEKHGTCIIIYHYCETKKDVGLYKHMRFI